MPAPRNLVERARQGDRAAFADLAAASVSRLFNIAQLMLGDRDLADDAVQETLVLAWRDLRGLRDADGFEAWLHRVLVRCVYREARRERRRSARILATADAGAYPDIGRDVADRDAIDRGFVGVDRSTGPSWSSTTTSGWSTPRRPRYSTSRSAP